MIGSLFKLIIQCIKNIYILCIKKITYIMKLNT